MGMHGPPPDPHLVWLYHRATIARTFPAYKLHELRDLPATELMQAMQLLNLAQQAMA